MKTLIVTLRIVGLISFAAILVFYSGASKKISLPYEIAYWTCLASFGSALLIKLFTSSFFPNLFRTSLFGYLRRDEELEVENGNN